MWNPNPLNRLGLNIISRCTLHHQKPKDLIRFSLPPFFSKTKLYFPDSNTSKTLRPRRQFLSIEITSRLFILEFWKSRVFINDIWRKIQTTDQYQLEEIIDQIDHLEYLYAILKEFNTIIILNKNLLIKYFQDGPDLLLKPNQTRKIGSQNIGRTSLNKIFMSSPKPVDNLFSYFGKAMHTTLKELKARNSKTKKLGG